MNTRIFATYLSIFVFFLAGSPSVAQKKGAFDRDNLVAWCIVPFDAQKRGPEERAAMLKEIGITGLAYDWRDEHIPTFDAELRALNNHGIRLDAFWLMAGKNAQENRHVKAVFDFLERNRVKTQIWLLMGEWKGFDQLSQQEKVDQMAAEIRYIAEKARTLGCKVGLYNHGGWFGEPENQLEIIQRLGMDNVGIVYNFHHARQHHQRFREFYPKIQRHLLCLNIAGLKDGEVNRFFRTGQGNVEKEMIRQVWKSGYRGPVGIINHDENMDAKKGLLEEMEGLKRILFEIGNKKALRSYFREI